MKKRIRRYLRDAQTRNFWRRFISMIACIVVFCTTYALLLPAITMEKTAACGFEEHQHVEECFEEKLTCGLEEGGEHTHTADCYTVEKHLVCKENEHVHNEDCYDPEGRLTCALGEHSHNGGCYEMDRILSCGQEETKGHKHTAACYEKILTCGKQVHSHSPACYKSGTAENDRKDSSESREKDRGSEEASESKELEEKTGLETAGSETAEFLYKEEAGQEINLSDFLTQETSVWFRPAEADDYGWNRVDGRAEVLQTDDIRLYYQYTIPAGTLDPDHPETRLALPENITLTDDQIEYINTAGDQRGAQVINGTRPPNAAPQDEETVAAWFRIENHPDENENTDGMDSAGKNDLDIPAAENGSAFGEPVNDRKTAFGEPAADTETTFGGPVTDNETTFGGPALDIVITFDDSVIEENRDHYEDGHLTRAGRDVSGFFSIDISVDQIDFEKDTKEARILLVPADAAVGTEENSAVLAMMDENGDNGTEGTEEDGLEGDTFQEADDFKEEDDFREAEDSQEDTFQEAEPFQETDTYQEEDAGKDNAEQGPSEEETFQAENITEEQTESAEEEHADTGDETVIEEGQAEPGDEAAPEEGQTEPGDEAAPEEDQTETSQAKGNEQELAETSLSTLTFEGDDYTVTATFDQTAGIPAGSVLSVKEITQKEKDYQNYREQAEQAVGGNPEETIAWVRLFDISIVKDDQVVEPSGPVSMQINYREAMERASNADVKTVHFEGEKETPRVLDTETGGTATAVEQVSFDTESFSVFAIVGTVIEKTVLASDGHNYRISVTYGDDAGVPEGADLAVEEIAPEYENYLEKVQEALGLDSVDELGYIRLFDIKIVDAYGEKVEITAPVEVRIELADKEEAAEAEGIGFSTRVVHFADGSETGDVLDSIEVTGLLGSGEAAGLGEDTTDSTAEGVAEGAAEGVAVSFETDGFSVYAIVDAPEPVQTEIQKVTSLDELADGTAFLISYDGLKHYFVNTLNGNNCFNEIGDSDKASEWYFEAVDSQAGTYKLYTYVNGEKKYVKNTSGNLVGLANTSDTVFEISDAGDGTFYFKKKGENKWLQHSNGGGGIRFYTDKNNATNSKMTITYASSYRPEDDPYDLDGKSFGIAYYNESTTGTALTPDAISGKNSLAPQSMLMRPDILDNEGVLLVSSNSDITEWTFHSVSEDTYYISANVNGEEKYLKIDAGKAVMTDSQEEASAITARPGTGSNSGKWHFSVDGYSLNYYTDKDGNDRRFNSATGSDERTWMSLVEKSQELTDDDFVSYTARKVSVSDTESVPDGAQVILYTRIWNDTTKRYEFYAVDHNGSLIRCYESGDVIEWVGGSINTAVWNFTDYQNGGVSSYYYELQNVYSGKYLVPKLEGGRVLSDSPVGVNMNGRRYGDDYTTIIAWDDPYYEYAGIRTEDGHIVSCPLAKAEDFYFAIVQPKKEEHALTEVETIDSNVYGISMKMIDYNNTTGSNPNWRDKDQRDFFNGDNNTEGLLSTNLGDDGYPTSTQAKTDHVESLSKLYNGTTPVNHLFLASKYNESGYFEYDSTQNAAHLNEDGTFTVYDQLFAVDTKNGPTRTHGQFMPYNEIDTSVIAPYTNQTDVLGNPLPDTDPRKGEEMFWANGPDADYFFGMEMEAGFTQTESGLDAWGHDIIFEFSGDDDFWFYVDGELVLDLGGVHAAMTGTINFRTGEVTSSRENSTLYEIFKKNYQTRGMSEAEISAKLDEIFTQNSSGQYVFKDYTNHTMKMFYMERGAGASNLHMRFNLAAVKPGTVVLSKSISGTDKPDYDLAEFPYQIYYRTKDDGGTQEHLLKEKNGDDYNVTYEGKSTPVKFVSEYTPAGGVHEYSNVFFLKPGQSAEIQLPENVIDYRIVECGINPSIYDKVTANDTELTGTDEDGDRWKDFAVEYDTPEERRKVDYDNHVDPNALRTLKITKQLYDADSVTLLSREDDPTTFSFRLYLGTENDEEPTLTNMHEYHVMNEQGFYCKWDNVSQNFVSLGVSDWAEVSDEDKTAATFTTSPNGSISKIPAGYSIVIHELVVGSKFKVEERAYELPEGYTLREQDGYTRVEGSYFTEEGESANAGIIRDNSSPEIEVRNQRGWGLTARKIWSDADYMESHAAIQMAVFIENEDGSLDMVPDSLKTLDPGAETLYWYYDSLAEGTTFDKYVIREVVTDGSQVTIIDQGEKLVVNGKQQGESEARDYTYSASYTQGRITGSKEGLENVRTDTVTNARSGIVIRKMQWDGTSPLKGATFVLKDADGNKVGQDKYVSDTDGLVTVAYLANGEYTLTETGTPNGYQGIPGDLMITVDGSEVEISGAAGVLEMCELKLPTETEGDEDNIDDEDDMQMPEITVRNRRMHLEAIKTGEEQALLSGAHFALYRQVIGGDGNPRKDYAPLTDYTDLVTGENGVIPMITEALAAGTYYLTETDAPSGYDKLTQDVLFTIHADGTVSIAENQGQLCSLASKEEEGVITYTLTVSNVKALRKIQIKKADIADPLNTALEGAEFDLYKVTDGVREEKPMYTGLRSGNDGLLAAGNVKIFELENGTYHLVETKAPDGYNMKTEAVVITITDRPAGTQGGSPETSEPGNGSETSESGNDSGTQGTAVISYDDQTSFSRSGEGVIYDPENDLYTIHVTNAGGYELPSTGGPGTGLIYLLGILLTAFAGAGLAMRRRRRDAA